MACKSLVRQSPSLLPEKPALPTDNRRRLPLIHKHPSKHRASLAEAAGSTAAGCAVLCCCFPCGLLHLLVVALKLPAALLRRRRRRRRRLWARSKAVVRKPKAGAFGNEIDHGLYEGPLMARSSSEVTWPANSPSREIAELEREMLAIFQSTGFWRSLSQRK